MTHTVSFHITLNTGLIQADRSLADWVQLLNVEHDAFVDVKPEAIDWDRVYLAIASDYFACGDHYRYVIEETDTITLD